MPRNQIAAIIATLITMLVSMCLPCESVRYHDVPGFGASGAARADLPSNTFC